MKYIAKRAAKNISSELSQMMVPTLVRFGRLTVGFRLVLFVAVAERRRTPPGTRQWFRWRAGLPAVSRAADDAAL
ncbi:hypothetical protein, partial [Streptomyces albidoflavus]|uniref:hypothetical protein n=1 Tax=Streptomyces albidoflavus TaxID=1886 RepID=UPI003F616B24